MSKIILDFGSGNSCRNDKAIVKRMYDELKAVDTGKHSVITKWQLFKEAGQNIPLNRDVFDFAYKYGRELGYQVTSSVFDKKSLDFLLQYEIPFVKIANNRALDWLIGEVPRRVPAYVSFGDQEEYRLLYDDESEFYGDNVRQLCCISKYPATLADYESAFRYWFFQGRERKEIENGYLQEAISDHTTDFELWNKYQPEIVEWHYMLPDSTGLDAGPFARTPAMLAEVL